MWVNCVDLVWNAILASLTNSNGGEEEAAAAVVAAAEDGEEGEQDGAVTTVLAAADTSSEEHASLPDPFVLAQELIQSHLFSTSEDEKTADADDEAHHVVLTTTANEIPSTATATGQLNSSCCLTLS